MSSNQSRAERNEQLQYRKLGGSGSSGQQRNSSGGSGKGGGGGTAPSPSSPSLSSNWSFKKPNNAQGGQSRASGPGVTSDSGNASAARTVQNGAHRPPPVHASDAPLAGGTVKLTDVPTQKSTRAVPKSPSSAAASSNTGASATPAKAAGDASKSFPLQFGSISPGFMNGMQIPARTNSAPPNLDEQKRDQARDEALRAPPTLPTPPVPKQQVTRKDSGTVDQSNTAEAHPIPRAKRDVLVSAPNPAIQTQKPSLHTMPGISMQVPFHQPQVSIQFGGPNPQIQSQGMAVSSMPMPMPMPLSMGNPPQVAQQVFVPGLQPHPMQSQGIMHQGQSLNFPSQMVPQLGNLGINIPPQFPQQQAGKFGGTRKAVKITHPDTHEELRLDNKKSDMYADSGSPGLRPHPNVQPQSQPVPSFPPSHPINYYTNSYNASSLYFPAQTSVPISTTQITPGAQSSRFANQVTVKPASGSLGEKVANSSVLANSSAVEKGESSSLPRPHGVPSSTYPQKDSETSSWNTMQQSKSGLETTSSPSVLEADKQSTVASGCVPGENRVPDSSSSAVVVVIDDSAEKSTSVSEGTRKDTVSRDQQKKPIKKGLSISQNQVIAQSISVSSLPSRSLVPENSLEGGILDPQGAKLAPTSSVNSAGALESPYISDLKIDCVGEGIGSEVVASNSLRKEKPTETVGTEGEGEIMLSMGSKQDGKRLEASLTSKSFESLQATAHNEESVSVDNEAKSLGKGKPEEPVAHYTVDAKVADNMVVTTSAVSDAVNAETVQSNVGLSTISLEARNSQLDDSLSRHDSINSKKVARTKSGMLDRLLAPVSIPPLPEAEVTEVNTAGLISPSALGSNDKPLLERVKSAGPKGRKKRKETLQKADAQGTTSDLYMAYRGPEEKRETVTPAESAESTASDSLKQASLDIPQEDIVSSDKSGQSKAEPDDWEDAADITTPQLGDSDNGKQMNGGLSHDGEDGTEIMTKKYSRDFLLKFAEHCTDLPEGFEITSDVSDAVLISNINTHRDSFPSPVRVIDRPMAGPRPDRRGGGMGDDERWSKFTGSLMTGRDMRPDLGFGGGAIGFRPGQGGNYGVLRNPRAQAPMQYFGGILSGPMQSLGPQGSMQRNSPDAERWQRATASQKGLMPSPQGPMQSMHKAEKKYEVGKVSDEEQGKQRQLKAILNKLTPQNFEKLFEQVKQVNIDNTITLTGVISQIFDKALTEPTFCEMYANFCYHLSGELPDLSVENEKISFKRLLLNKCQEEFERGEREQEEANRADEEGDSKQSEEEREEKRLRARRRMLGNIRLIGELYKKKMLTERIMHECIKKLLGQYQNPDEEDVEALCKLMSTIGDMIDHPKAKEHMDAYFGMMAKLSNNMKLSPRVRFMLKDSIDLRKNKWQQRRKVEGPKKIEEVHRDAAQERQAQASRLARTPSMSSSVRRGQPMDFAPRGSNALSSPSAQMGGFRGVPPPQLRVFGGQDVRFEDRHSFENRTLSVPLPQRPMGEDSITLGPQGGLARGMSFRGQPSMPSIPLNDMPSPGDSRRTATGLNGYSSVPERTGFGPRENLIPRFMPERFFGQSSYDQMSAQERTLNYGSRDIRAERSLERSVPTSPPARGRVPSLTPNASEQVLPEERLQEMSIAAIKEYYSARDEKEVALCIKDLNAPSFHPSMISIWVTDSFERKDMERDLLAKLLINLDKSQGGVLSQDQLMQGFEAVLTTLEDAVNDAPKAAEFLGRIFAKVIMENVLPLADIGQLIHEGGEDQGRLVEIGLAAEVLASVLEIIKSEKGDSVLNAILVGSNLRLEDFRPPNSNKSWRLDKFI